MYSYGKSVDAQKAVVVNCETTWYYHFRVTQSLLSSSCCGLYRRLWFWTHYRIIVLSTVITHSQYYVLTSDPLYTHVVAWIRNHALTCSIHLNRVRFWVPVDSPLYTDFILRFRDHCPPVDTSLDLATGL